jgi:hypothetical protein
LTTTWVFGPNELSLFQLHSDVGQPEDKDAGAWRATAQPWVGAAKSAGGKENINDGIGAGQNGDQPHRASKSTVNGMGWQALAVSVTRHQSLPLYKLWLQITRRRTMLWQHLTCRSRHPAPAMKQHPALRTRRILLRYAQWAATLLVFFKKKKQVRILRARTFVYTPSAAPETHQTVSAGRQHLQKASSVYCGCV